MNHYSQAGQDRFVEEVLIKSGVVTCNSLTRGSFLDIGAGGRSISNTLGLEEIGWFGWLVDNSEGAKKDSEMRPSNFICANAVELSYAFLPAEVDYLSLDVDGATPDVVQRFPWNKTQFRVITVEHDAYRFGRGPREMMRAILGNHDYQLICADVRNPEPFEDWWVSKEVLEHAKKFICNGKQWEKIFGV